jgi:hypothetical protein
VATLAAAIICAAASPFLCGSSGNAARLRRSSLTPHGKTRKTVVAGEEAGMARQGSTDELLTDSPDLSTQIMATMARRLAELDTQADV